MKEKKIVKADVSAAIINCNNKYIMQLSDLKDVTAKDCSYCVLTSILTIAPSLIYLNLIQKENINYLDPLIKPMGLLVTAIFGIILFKESLCRKQIIGGAIILIGTGIFLSK